MSLPLTGITVVALEHAIAAPFCTRQLADLGARVIKIERIKEGDFARHYDDRVLGQSSHFVWANRSKQSVALDLKEPASRRVLDALVANADVLVQNLGPGAASRLGLSFETLRADYPRLIVCDVSGYGSEGKYRDKKAYDLLIQAEAGLLSISGTKHAPCKSGISIADIAAGMYAYSGILTALIQRQRTGLGSHVNVSMLESLVEWMGYPLYYAFNGASPPTREGSAHASIYPYGPFDTKDGTVIFAIQNEREWESFCRIVLQQPHLSTSSNFRSNALRHKNREYLQTLISDVFEKCTTAAVERMLEEARIANGRMNDMHAVWDHPQLKETGKWAEVETPNGLIPALLPPAQNSSFDFVMGAVPKLGQHTERIMHELGLFD